MYYMQVCTLGNYEFNLKDMSVGILFRNRKLFLGSDNFTPT